MRFTAAELDCTQYIQGRMDYLAKAGHSKEKTEKFLRGSRRLMAMKITASHLGCEWQEIICVDDPGGYIRTFRKAKL